MRARLLAGLLAALVLGAAAWAIGRGVHLARLLVWVGIGAAVLATLLGGVAVAERRAQARFAREAEALRAARPDDVVTPYVGPEGEGLRFEGPGGGGLLLRPEGGVGAPSWRWMDAAAPPGEPTSADVGIEVPPPTEPQA